MILIKLGMLSDLNMTLSGCFIKIVSNEQIKYLSIDNTLIELGFTEGFDDIIALQEICNT